MKNFVNTQDWALKIFTSLCFSQVKEQLPENLIYRCSNPASFICKGNLFALANNRSFLPDELLTGSVAFYN
ncbi:MAG: hypothetical protein ABIQ31_08310 [Ferruginibacter sp.]